MITCWRHRKIILGSADANTALPDPTREHLRNCSDCRRVYESQTEIAWQLRETAGSINREPSPFLHARIMSSIARSEINPGRDGTRIRFGWSFGLVAACLLLAGALWFRNQPMPDRLSGFQRPLASASAAPELYVALELPNGTQMRQWTVKLDEPLQKEMNLVVDNTKTAANALAENFMPEKLRHSWFDQAQN